MPTTFRKPAQIASDALRAELKMRLAECTEKQQELFGKLFPGGVDGLPEVRFVPDTRLAQALELCQRTLAKRASDTQGSG